MDHDPALNAALDDVLGPNDVVFHDARLPPEEMDARTTAVAAALLDAGVGHRDVVAWQLPNAPESVLLYRACWRIGAVAMPLHHAWGTADVDAALDAVRPTLLVVDPTKLGDRRRNSPPITQFRKGVAGRDPATIIFTSGSSGRPKGVRHSHRAWAYKARTMVDVHRLTADDVVLMPAPLAHVSGLLNGVLVAAVAGMRTVLMDRWDPDDALALIERERVTFMVGPPTFFLGLMHAATFAPERVASLRLVSSGGAGVTPAFIDEASAALGCIVKRTYGSTEVPTVATTYAGDPPERGRDTDGRAVGRAEMRLADTGELEVRGPEMLDGYVDPNDDADAFTDDGWFRTGDLATIDDGWLTITGRLKDVVIRGGENVATAEVEAVLESHPSVRQAVVVGEPDERLGERVAAFVVATDFDLDACRRWFEQKGLARFKWPERLITVEILPILPTGKPDRNALRERLRRH